MIVEKNRWDIEYDVLVIGFGGAGASAARFAADKGAKTLLIDKAPEGHEGGNTRYSGQMIASTDNAEEYRKYFSKLASPLDLDKAIIDVFVAGVADMRTYLSEFLDVTPFSFKENPEDPAVLSVANDFPDYPSYQGVDSFDLLTVHQGKTISDGALWTVLRNKVLERTGKIDIWYETPAIKLIQNSDGVVEGAVVRRKDTDVYVHVQNGIVITAGGFENDDERIQNWLGVKHLVPMGTLYNTGDSIKLAGQVGADMWHNTVYNAAGLFNGLSYKVETGQRGTLSYTWPQMYSGSIFVAGGDGSRYFNESEAAKEGYLYTNGYWRHSLSPDEPYMIFDKKQLDVLEKIDDLSLKDALEKKITASSPEELAKQLNFDAEIFKETLANFNFFAEAGVDYEYKRVGGTLTKFDRGELYAVAMLPMTLNTQGGPRRNEKAQVLDTYGEPIPHLYGAGEAGSITTNQYQAGQDLAECLIFGKIAGEAAALEKEDVLTNITHKRAINLANILKSDETDIKYHTENNQYVGYSSSGMGNELIVRVTIDTSDSSLKSIEVLKNSETEEIGQKILPKVSAEMIKNNSVDIDVVSGATTTTNALKEAVIDALKQVEV